MALRMVKQILAEREKPAEILELAKVCVACRPQYEFVHSSNHFREHAHTFKMPSVDIASSAIRQRVREGKSIQYLVPWTIKTFIEANKLYTSNHFPAT